MIFKEAVKCTDKELSLKIPQREHREIVDRILSGEQTKARLQQQQDYSKNYKPPTRQKSR